MSEKNLRTTERKAGNSRNSRKEHPSLSMQAHEVRAWGLAAPVKRRGKNLNPKRRAFSEQLDLFKAVK